MCDSLIVIFSKNYFIFFSNSGDSRLKTNSSGSLKKYLRNFISEFLFIFKTTLLFLKKKLIELKKFHVE